MDYVSEYVGEDLESHVMETVARVSEPSLPNDERESLIIRTAVAEGYERGFRDGHNYGTGIVERDDSTPAWIQKLLDECDAAGIPEYVHPSLR